MFVIKELSLNVEGTTNVNQKIIDVSHPLHPHHGRFSSRNVSIFVEFGITIIMQTIPPHRDARQLSTRWTLREIIILAFSSLPAGYDVILFWSRTAATVSTVQTEQVSTGSSQTTSYTHNILYIYITYISTNLSPQLNSTEVTSKETQTLNANESLINNYYSRSSYLTRIYLLYITRIKRARIFDFDEKRVRHICGVVCRV